MAKTIDTSRVLRSIVSPALGLSIGVLAAAGASVGCGSSDAGSGAAAPDKLPAPGTFAVAGGSAQPTAQPSSSGTTAPAQGVADPPVASGTTTASTTATSRVPRPAPVGSVSPIPPPGIRPKVGIMMDDPTPGPAVPVVGTTAQQPHPGTIPAPGKVAAPGFAPSGLVIAASTERPTRPTRRATDPDLRMLRQRGRSLV